MAKPDTTHECPHPTCTRRVSRDRLACPPHWFQLPKDIRDRVWATYRSGDGHGHREAIADALDYFSTQDGRQ
jgi:hypothetical protein